MGLLLPHGRHGAGHGQAGLTGAARPIIVHGRDEAEAAAAAAASLGLPLTLVSAPGAGGYAGAGWWAALVVAVRARHPDLALTAILDCGDQPGAVLAALRAGLRDLCFTGDPGMAAKLQAIAAQSGVTLRTITGVAFDPRGARDPQAACRAWLAGGSGAG